MDLATLGIRVDASGAIQTVGQLDGKLSGLQKTSTALTGAIAKLGVTIGAGVIFNKFITETTEAQYAQAQLEARVKSTGMAAGLSATQLDEMATAMQRQTAYADDAIKGAQSLLLTFTQIKGDVFQDATMAVANLATALGSDLKGAAIQLGKALNDPAQGLAALRKSGVSFSDAQQEVIKNLFATGRQAEAQRIILKELEVEFGGAAEAARNTLGGALQGLNNAFGDLFEISAEGSGVFVGAINTMTRAMETLNRWIGTVHATWKSFQVSFANGSAAVATSMADMAAKIPGLGHVVDNFRAVAQRWEGVAVNLLLTGDEFATAMPKLTDAIETATKSTYAMALADERAARAKALLNAQVSAAIDMEEKLARGVRFDLKQPTMQVSSIGRLPDAGVADAARKAQEQVTKTSLEESAKRAQGELAAWMKANEEITQLRTNFLRGMQESFAKTFEDIFTKGIKSFGDLFDRMKQLFVSAASQLLSMKLMEKLKDAMTPKATASLTSAAGSAGPVLGMIGVGVGLFVDGLGKAAAASRAMAEEFKRNTMIGRSAQERLDAMFAGTTGASRIEGDRQSALKDAWDTWAISGGGADWDALRARVNEYFNLMQQRLEDQIAFTREMATQDLAVRALRAKGENDAADAQALFNQQLREFAKAVEDGMSDEYLAYLAQVQTLERDALDAKLATAAATSAQAEIDRKLAESAREAAEAMAEIQKAADRQTDERMGLSELRVRELRMAGLNDEADALALFNQQVREFRDAVNAGWSPEALAYLSGVQERERATQAATATARKAAEAQDALADAQRVAAEQAEAAATMILEAQQRAAEVLSRYADAGEDLSVRMLKATGQMAEADRMAFDLQQSRERRQVEQEMAKLAAEQAAIQAKWTPTFQDLGGGRSTPLYGTDPVLGYLGSMQAQSVLKAQWDALQAQLAAANDYLTQLKGVQAAENAAFTNGPVLAGASAAVPGTAGSFNTIVSRATSAQGDRMLDELTTSRTLQQTYLPYLRTIAERLAGGVNALLGADLQSAQTLAGSSLVA